MRVVAVLPGYLPARVGAWLATHGFLRHVAAAGHHVTVHAPHIVHGTTIDGVHVTRSRTNIGELIRRADVLVVHATPAANRAIQIARNHGVPVVGLVHGPGSAHTIDADMIVANAETSRPAGVRSIVCHPPVDRAAHQVDGIGDAVTIVNLSADKGVKTAWRAAERLPHREFLGVKGGYGQQVIPRTANFEVLGVQRDMREVWRRTRMLLMPSAFEAWGMVGVEAMCSGIPVIAHPTPGLVESLGDAGIFVDRDDTDGWVTAIERLHDPDEWAAASARARARADQLDSQVDLDRFLEMIEGLSRRPVTRPRQRARVAVVIPYRDGGCEWRRRAKATVASWWETITRGEWEIIEADDGGDPFSRGASINTGIARCDADVVVAADSDLLIGRDAIVEAARLAAAGPGVVQPFDRVAYHTGHGTERLHGEPWRAFTDNSPEPMYEFGESESTPLMGGINVFSRETWERAGGFLPCFRGWGLEDLAWWTQVATLVAPARRVRSTAHHLYHPKGGTYAAAPTVAENAARWEQVAAAAGDPDAMRRVVAELGGRVLVDA